MVMLQSDVIAGLDHSSDVDEEYNGYGIPARSALVANLKYELNTSFHDI